MCKNIVPRGPRYKCEHYVGSYKLATGIESYMADQRGGVWWELMTLVFFFCGKEFIYGVVWTSRECALKGFHRCATQLRY